MKVKVEMTPEEMIVAVKCYEELKAYRKTGYTPEQVQELHDKHWMECMQIAKYDDELNGNRGLNNLNEHLMKINRYTRNHLTADEVYMFDVILCDNDIDRDGECFSDAAIEQMKGLFIGKTGIFDHNPRSSGQTARIYDTEIVQDAEKKTADGRPYVCLKAHAYMVRTQANEALIAEIEGGIKKEVSVSCCAAKRICSVCGADRRESACGHIDGRMYGEKQCHTILDDIIDAYEWSFVAVPVPVKKKRKEDEGK